VRLLRIAELMQELVGVRASVWLVVVVAARLARLFGVGRSRAVQVVRPFLRALVMGVAARVAQATAPQLIWGPRHPH